MLAGYSDSISVKPGSTLDVRVSTDKPTCTAEVVRLIHGDPNPVGPGYLDEKTDWLPKKSFPGRVQQLHLGSYLSLPAPREAISTFTFGCWILPTNPLPKEQCIFVWGDTQHTWTRLFINEAGRLVANLGEAGRCVASVESDALVFPARWQFAGILFDREGRELGLFLAQAGATGAQIQRTPATLKTPSFEQEFCYLGANLATGKPANAFNGKIGRPVLFTAALNDFGICDLQLGAKPQKPCHCFGDWDLSREIETDRLVDVSGQSHHGQAHHLPARGATGPNWRGGYFDTYRTSPGEYDAIHLHEDDLEDAGWDTSVTVQIPPNAKSGIYAAHLTAGNEEAWITFVVRAGTGSKSPVLVLAPTLTWHAYSNRAIAEERDSGLSLYTNHVDGTANYYCTLHKPNYSLSPKDYFKARGMTVASYPCSHLVMAHLYLIHWLEHMNVDYEVISDHDLHSDGSAALNPHRVLFFAGHHEYWTHEMLDGLEEYLGQGGRLINLAGNALYWVTSLHPEKPYLMEVRRYGGLAVAQAEPGELQHSFTGEPGGTWRHRGRTPNQLIGVGMMASGFFDKGAGYCRLPESFDPRVGFIFDGIEADEIIGDFGLNQGGASGYEMDAADDDLGTPPGSLVLGSSFGFAPSFSLTVEEGVAHGPDPKVRSDMVYFETGQGGAVFSVGSVTWPGSLSHNGFHNNVSRLTWNTLNHFLNS